ncbi:MAG: sigma 54-interacting transcriptional regulator [Deltaproteobacteria bacterium]|nr:sigma 54-interacting transcriptional regulator [Deltaproteobacteria bacterium]
MIENKTTAERENTRLQFEMLLSEISTALINVPHDKIDRELEIALKRLVEFLGFDRSSIYQISGFKVLLTHTWAVDGFKNLERAIPEVQLPWISKTILNNRLIYFSKIDDLPAEAAQEKEFYKKHGLLSMVIVPMIVSTGFIGSVSFGAFRAERSFSSDLLERIRLIGTIFANALQRKMTERSLQDALAEVRSLKDQLQAECGYLKEEIELHFVHKGIVGQSQALKKVLSQIEQVAVTGSTVLLLGETGTGKELLARTIHNLSPRSQRAMLKVNCGALPPSLIESELFGHEKGAFTGASSRQLGRFEVADGSTLFLDEISELPLELQSKLLRDLQEGQFERLGSPRTISIDVRIIAATNKDLNKAVREGSFRQDLFYRLNVFPLKVPPLRDRREDIPDLVWDFVREFEPRMGKTIKNIRKESLDALGSYDWPGNVRELRNVIERAMILCKGSILHFDIQKDQAVHSEISEPFTLEEIEKKHIQYVLNKTGWRIRGRGGAAEILGLKPTTLDSRIKKLGLTRRPSIL